MWCKNLCEMEALTLLLKKRGGWVVAAAVLRVMSNAVEGRGGIIIVSWCETSEQYIEHLRESPTPADGGE